MGRELGWEELKSLWRWRRELLKASLTARPRFRRSRRSLGDAAKLAQLAREGFEAMFEVVELRGRERVLRMRF